MTEHLLRELIKIQNEQHALQMQALHKILARIEKMSDILQIDTAAVTAIGAEITTIATTVADLGTQFTTMEGLLTDAQAGGTPVDQAALAAALASAKTSLDALNTSASTLDTAVTNVTNPPAPASPTPATS